MDRHVHAPGLGSVPAGHGQAIRIVPAHDGTWLPQVRELFLEYAASLHFDLCFQGFQEEMAALPGKYRPPEGRLLAALDGDAAVGCVGLRKLGDGVCEMKRLYVRSAHRGKGIGRRLAEVVIAEARLAGYRTMRLDTLSSMLEATALYRSIGFQRIDPYYGNPCDTAVFLELDLRGKRGGTEQETKAQDV